jgi:Lrp/AsnC family transcriptional regulator, regulator for asnA, asnC and gidA
LQRSISPDEALLIRHLQDSPRASYAELARATGSSESTVKRRVESLLERGVIHPSMHADLEQLGIDVRAMIGFRVQLDKLTSVAKHLSQIPDVTFVALTAGRFDVIAFVAKRSLVELTRFMTDDVGSVDGVISSETLITTEVYKQFGDWRMPLDGADVD